MLKFEQIMPYYTLSRKSRIEVLAKSAGYEHPDDIFIIANEFTKQLEWAELNGDPDLIDSIVEHWRRVIFQVDKNTMAICLLNHSFN